TCKGGVMGGWSLFENCTVDASICGQVFKGARWMPWHQEPMKDVGGHDTVTPVLASTSGGLDGEGAVGVVDEDVRTGAAAVVVVERQRDVLRARVECAVGRQKGQGHD
ncbi:hypothetical protein PUR49_00695, partial [Streptomyces sp. BE147]|uniref:hypothetical protein n=1 Tax=Streptomyces sp. BE147 TaxID=3002524 RepID=UPI002E782B07